MSDQEATRSEVINALGDSDWVHNLIEAGFGSGTALAVASDKELMAVEGVAEGRLGQVREAFSMTAAPDNEPDEPADEAPEAEDEEAEEEVHPWDDVDPDVLELHRRHVLMNLPETVAEQLRAEGVEQAKADLKESLGEQIEAEVKKEVIPVVKAKGKDKLFEVEDIPNLRFMIDGDTEIVYYLMPKGRGEFQLRVFHRG